MATKTKPAPPLHRLAFIKDGLTRDVTQSHPLLTAAAATLPGYAQKIDAINTICAAEEQYQVQRAAATPLTARIAEQARNGAVTLDVHAEAIAEATAAAAANIAITALRDAKATVSSDLHMWLIVRLDDLRAALAANLAELVDTVRADAARLTKATTAEAAIASGNAQAWADAENLAARYREIRAAQRAIDRSGGQDPVQHYPLVAVMPDTLAAWPLAVTPLMGRTVTGESVIHDGLPPWPDPASDTLAFLLWCVARRVELWVPTVAQMRDAAEKLHEEQATATRKAASGRWFTDPPERTEHIGLNTARAKARRIA